MKNLIDLQTHRVAAYGVLLGVLLALLPVKPSWAERALIVFAAASLGDALSEIAHVYENQSGQPILFSFASSSTLARQIEAGAPADLFLSADVVWSDYLVERGHLEAATRIAPLSNRLVLVASAEQSKLLNEPDFSAWIQSLQPRDWLAAGDPAHVPAGRYAKQALKYVDLWDAYGPRLARADNVRGALALVDRGEAPLGLVYATDVALGTNIRAVAVVPEDAHDPISYVFGLVADGPIGSPNEAARSFLSFLGGEEARQIFEDYGFLVDARS